MKNKKKLILNIAKVGFTILFVYFLFNIVDVASILELYGRLTISTIVVCSFLYLLINILRTARFCTLSGQNKNYSKLNSITLTHGIYNRILPLRLGEGIYPYLMHKYFKYPIAESAFNILIVRMMDLLSTVNIFVITFVISQSMSIILQILLSIISSICFFAVLPLACRLYRTVEGKIKLDNKKFAVPLVNFFEKNVDKVNCKNVAILFVLSSLIWIIMFTVFGMIFKDFNLEISITDLYMAGSFSNISSILPISSFGNFGTMELGWGGVLIMLGYDNELAILSGLSANLFTFTCTVGLGLIGMLMLKIIDLRDKTDAK